MLLLINVKVSPAEADGNGNCGLSRRPHPGRDSSLIIDAFNNKL
jgi:hypothetical protein